MRACPLMFFGFLLYRVEGESMTPSLRAGDYLLVHENTRSKRLLNRGDIVVVNHFGNNQFKRIVALPREQIVLTGGMLLIDGERLIEPYLNGLPPYLGLDESSYELGDDEFFLMGDNRAHSTDSRDYGSVHRSQIESGVVCRVWPLLRLGR